MVGALVHPVGMSTQVEERGFGTQLAEEKALGLSFGGGAWLGRRCRQYLGARLCSLSVTSPRWRGFPASQSYANVRGLNSGAVFEKKIAEGYSGGYAEGGTGIFVVLLDAGLEVGEGLLNAFARKARRLGARDGLARGSSEPLIFSTAGSAGRVSIALGLQEGQDLVGFVAIDV
jgi:hypothetical protein